MKAAERTTSLVVTTFVVFLAVAPAARAATEADFAANTTAELVALCDAAPDSGMGAAALGFCYGFAQGAVSVQIQHDAGSRAGKLFCLPSPLPARAATVREFVTWARASDERLRMLPADGVMAFLRDRYTCSTTK